MRNFCRDLEQQMVLDLARGAVYLFTRHCELIARRGAELLSGTAADSVRRGGKG